MYLPLFLLVLSLTASNAAYSVTYIDSLNSWWPPTAIASGIGVPSYAYNSSYNIINLSFWLTSAPTDVALVWSDAFKYVSSVNPWGSSTQAVQAAWLQLYHQRGIKVLVSAFGSTEFPTSSGIDPVQCGTDLANFVKTNQLDGVDLDWEDNAAMEAGKGEAWLISITQTLRNLLPKEQGYIISHAPQAPYFMGTSKYPNGGYLTIDKAVGDLIDFYNIQFYNQGTSTYDNYTTLFTQSNGWSTGTSVGELVSKGIPLSRIVVGKPVTTGDADNTGYVQVDTLEEMFKTARGTGWGTGFMGWQYKSDVDGSWSDKLASAFQ